MPLVTYRSRRRDTPRCIKRQETWRRTLNRIMKAAKTPSEVLTGRCCKCRHLLVNHPRRCCLLCRCTRHERGSWGRKFSR